jgi:hypothetical protein
VGPPRSDSLEFSGSIFWGSISGSPFTTDRHHCMASSCSGRAADGMICHQSLLKNEGESVEEVALQMRQVGNRQ